VSSVIVCSWSSLVSSRLSVGVTNVGAGSVSVRGVLLVEWIESPLRNVASCDVMAGRPTENKLQLWLELGMSALVPGE